MEDLQKALESLEKGGSLDKTINNADEMIRLLTAARDNVSNNPTTAAMELAKLQQTVKKSFEQVNGALKDVHSANSKYTKALNT
ncbi:hypothetical protein LTS18_003735, partial [Coniosporium uncinatum]